MHRPKPRLVEPADVLQLLSLWCVQPVSFSHTIAPPTPQQQQVMSSAAQQLGSRLLAVTAATAAASARTASLGSAGATTRIPAAARRAKPLQSSYATTLACFHCPDRPPLAMARVRKRVAGASSGRSARQQQRQRPGIKQPTSRCCQQPRYNKHQRNEHKQQQQP